MEKDTTRNLSHKLERMHHQQDGDQFISEHGSEDISFASYLQEIMDAGGLSKSDVVSRSGISKNYVYNILSGSKSNPGRDKILALCIASKMNYRQTQRALEISKAAPLYPRNERDVRIAIAINSGICDVIKVNLLLDEYGLTPLDI